VIFFRPLYQDLEVVAAALNLFAETSGLYVNLQKSSTTCIRCDDETALRVADHFHCINKDFPINYLGLPLSTGRLRRADIWPLIDKYSDKFKGWKPRFLRASGRLQLTRSVLMALPLHLLAVLPPAVGLDNHQQTLPWFYLERGRGGERRPLFAFMVACVHAASVWRARGA
jgi:hypothetical protein